jgi:uncharacterized protein (DUF1501 family)
MKRRNFLKASSAASLGFMLNGLPVKVFATNPLLQLLAKQTQANGKVIVLIQLSGGNDGLNTVIPLDQYPALSGARGNILIPPNKVLSLANTTVTGLHPAMTGIQTMFNNGLVNIVQGVSYPDPDFSHFRATDIWMSGSDSNQYLDTGWLGRYLENEYANYPVGYPNATTPDPLAIQIGSTLPLATQGSNVNMGMAISDVNNFYNIVNNTVNPAPNTPAGHELTFIRFITQQTQQYNGVLQTAAQKGKNLSTKYPTTGNRLADQLKIVARLIHGGLKTPVFIVNIGGFDTHSAQTDSADPALGAHANLLQQLSDAVYAFFDDCVQLDIHERVAAMTFSEFGRRIKSNASGGTDHGTAQPVMVFGHKVNPGFIGSNPVIKTNTTAGDNLPMQHDYRGVYAAILADWFDVPLTVMNSLLLNTYTVLPVFQKTSTPTSEEMMSGSNETLGQNYPNPFSRTTTVSFGSDGGIVTIQLFDATGRLVKTVLNREVDRGMHEITINRDNLDAGIYFCRLINGKHKSTRQMIVVD